jgi:hypothetical protein
LGFLDEYWVNEKTDPMLQKLMTCAFTCDGTAIVFADWRKPRPRPAGSKKALFEKKVDNGGGVRDI